MRMSGIVSASLAKLFLEHSPVEAPTLISTLVFLDSNSRPAPVGVVGRVGHAGVRVNLGNNRKLPELQRQLLTKRWAGPTPVPTHSCLTRWSFSHSHLLIAPPLTPSYSPTLYLNSVHFVDTYWYLVDSVDLVAACADCWLYLEPGHVEINRIMKFFCHLNHNYSGPRVI